MSDDNLVKSVEEDRATMAQHIRKLQLDNDAKDMQIKALDEMLTDARHAKMRSQIEAETLNELVRHLIEETLDRVRGG